MPATLSLSAVAVALAVAAALLTACSADDAASAPRRRNDRAPHTAIQARSDDFQLISSSNSPPKAEDKVASADLPAAEKQYDYPLVRPVYAPFVTRPSSYAVPFVEILDHHRDRPKPGTQHYVGNPMVSSVVVQDMSQTPATPRPPNNEAILSLVDNFHHLGPTKIPFTDVQVVTKPLGKPSATKIEPGRNPGFTDKVEENSLEDYSSSSDSDEDEDDFLEEVPSLDMTGIVEDVVRKVFRENAVLEDASHLIPKPPPKSWSCPPVTCCSKPTGKRRKCSTFVSTCVAGRSPVCPLRSERVQQQRRPGALSGPANANATDPHADLRDGEPRFKKKKMLKKKKKMLKKFMMPLLMAYKLLFVLVVPLMVNGMMMMMSSSGMAGFFFALIGASMTMGGFRRSQPVIRHPVTESKTQTEVVTVGGSGWSGPEVTSFISH